MLLRGLVFVAALACLGGCGSFAFAQNLQQPGFSAYINGNSTPLSSAPVSFASSGNNIVIAGQTGKVIRVFRLALVPFTSVTMTVKDGAATALTGAMPLAANQELSFPFDTQPVFITSAGNAFEINLSSGVPVAGVIGYTIN